MVEFDELENRMVLKLINYGPAMSGKTINLLQLHDKMGKDHRGDVTVLNMKLVALRKVLKLHTRHEWKSPEYEIMTDENFIFCQYFGIFKQNFCKSCMISLEGDRGICPSCGLQQYEIERSNSNERFHSFGR